MLEHQPEEHRHASRSRRSVYNHNFFTHRLAADRPGHRRAFPVRAARGAPAQRSRRGARQGDRLPAGVRREGRPSSRRSTASAPTASDYDFRIENRKTGAGVRITGDRPLVEGVFWSARNLTVCPEPYIDVSVEPGQGIVVAHHLRVLPGRSAVVRGQHVGPSIAETTMNRRDAITSMSIAGGASLIPSGEADRGRDLRPECRRRSSRRCAARRRSRFATSRPS